MKLPSIVSLMAVLSTGCIDTTPDPIVFCKDSAYPYWCEKAKKCCSYPYHDDTNKCYETLAGCTSTGSTCEMCVIEKGNPIANSPKTQTWELTFHDNMHPQTVKVTVKPFTNSGTFSETSDSPGVWMFDASGSKCFRLPVGGNIVHDSPGDRWSFVGMGGSGCGMQTLGSNSSGTANGNFPFATLINNGVVTLTTKAGSTFSVTVNWTGVKK